MSKPSKAFIVTLDNNKRFAISFNEKTEMVVMFGKYTDTNKTNFKVILTKTFGNTSLSSQYSESDLKERDNISKIIAPYINDLKQRSEKINGL